MTSCRLEVRITQCKNKKPDLLIFRLLIDRCVRLEPAIVARCALGHNSDQYSTRHSD